MPTTTDDERRLAAARAEHDQILAEWRQDAVPTLWCLMTFDQRRGLFDSLNNGRIGTACRIIAEVYTKATGGDPSLGLQVGRHFIAKLALLLLQDVCVNAPAVPVADDADDLPLDPEAN